MSTAGTSRVTGTQTPSAGSRPSRALAQDAPPPKVDAAEISAMIHSQSTVATMLPDTAGTDAAANAATTPTSRPATTVSVAAIRGSPPSGGWLAAAGRTTRGSTTSAPTAAVSATAIRSPMVAACRARRACQAPAYPPATTATIAKKATQVSRAQASRTASYWRAVLATDVNGTLYSAANRAASSGVRLGPRPPTMTGGPGRCTGLGSAGASTSW